ncbi:MAG: DUF3105 domain-containing protein [Actinomycetota bacterium]|nr:DUF3105 domain-containing protein [Actinomycetota bacterium]
MVDGGDPEEPEHAGSERSGRRAIGYAVAGGAILIAVVTIVVALASLDGGGSEGAPPSPGADAGGRDRVHDLLPEDGSFPPPERVGSVREGARMAGCELESFGARSNLHIASPDQTVRYRSDPPTSGRHHPLPAEDAAYAISPDVRRIVHTLEHGRVVVWFDSDLPREARASLKAFYLDEPHHILLVPDTTGMPYAVAATAWNKEPGRYGTGRLLGCRDYGDDVFTALDAFRDRHLDRGPELVP